MRSIVTCLALLTVAAACENSTDPFIGLTGGGGGAITQIQAAGDWSFTLRKTATLPCTGGSLPDNQVLTAHADVLSDGRLSGSTSSWATSPAGSVGPLTGTVRLSDGFTDFIMSASAGSASAMELRGTMTSVATFTGTLTDPAPGFSPMFSVGGCEYTATGTKA